MNFTGTKPGPDGVLFVEGYADAVVDSELGLLICTTVDESQYLSMSEKVSKYHACDITFYYESIKQNVKDRIAAFNSM